MIVEQKVKRGNGTIDTLIYQKYQKIGQGGYGSVYRVKRLKDNQQFALKVIPKFILQDLTNKKKMLSEIRIHTSIKHKYICNLKKVFQDDQNVYMLMQLCKNGSMLGLLKKRKRLSIPQIQYYIYQLIDVLCYLHKQQILHRDVKLGNLLINDKMEIKLTDFGLATKLQFIGDRKYTLCGTPNYIAPQIIGHKFGSFHHSGHSYEVDVWGIGIIIFIMLTGDAPFQDKDADKTFKRVLELNYKFPYKTNTLAKDLIRKILVLDPAKRLTFQQILNHSFMNPPNGIPKQLPVSSLKSVPILQNYQKEYIQDVKNSAKNSYTKRMTKEIQISLGDQPELSGKQKQKSESTTWKEKQQALRDIFSTSSFQHCIQKSMNIKKVTSDKNIGMKMQTLPQNSYFYTQRSQNEEKNCIFQFLPSIQQRSYEMVYVVDYKKQIVWTYLLSNGYVGTYQSVNKYRMLYNSTFNKFFQCSNQTFMKPVPPQQLQQNDNVLNRMKFTNNLAKRYNYRCQPYQNQELIYVKNIYEVKQQNLMLFKLSNNDTQAFNYQTNMSLIVSKLNIILIQVKDGIEISRVEEKKSKIKEVKNKVLHQFYIIVKKILIKLTNLGK